MHSIARSALGSALFMTLAMTMPAVAAAQDDDPSDEPPPVSAAGLIAAAKSCVAAAKAEGIDTAALGTEGWTRTEAMGEGDESVDGTVVFLTRAEGDPLLMIPTIEDVSPVCVATGVVAGGEAEKAQIQVTFNEAFGEGQVDEEQSVYTVPPHVIVLEFEDDEEQGLIAQAVVVLAGE